MGLDGEARPQRGERGVGLDLGGVDVELAAPHQARVRALLGDGFEEAPEDVQPVPLADAGEAGAYLATTSGTWSSETDGRSMPNFLRKVDHFIDAPIRSGTPVLTVHWVVSLDFCKRVAG